MIRKSTTTLRRVLSNFLGLQHPRDLYCEWCHYDRNNEDEWTRLGEPQIHHIVPVSTGGTNDEANLICLCRSCHEELHRIMREPWPGGTAGPWESGLSYLLFMLENSHRIGREALAFMCGMKFEREWQEKYGQRTKKACA